MAGEWLTYAQAGERFGLSADAVRMRAHRLGWRMQPGNDGRTLVLVPEDATVQPRARSPERSEAHSDERSPAQTAGDGKLAAAEGRAILAEQKAEQAEQRANRAEIRADAADADRRAAEVRADAATARADAADADRRAAEARADRLDQALIGERGRAEELLGRLDDLHGKLTDAQVELAAAMDRTDRATAELETAQIALGEARADAAELRQAEEARKGRGRLARLRAAWRGE
jgi:colicin import membrane protein